MKRFTFLTKTLGMGLFIWYTIACTSTPSKVNDAVGIDSTYTDTGVVNAEDTAIMNYAPANETFVDEGGEGEDKKEKIDIEE